ncbi:MAG: hypothetical protein ABIH50_07730 [bacterium]
MLQENSREQYDVASISKEGREKRINTVRDALYMSKLAKPTGQFVQVFADMFLKKEAGRKCYF